MKKLSLSGKKNGKPAALAALPIAGFVTIYIVPLGMSLWYSFLNNSFDRNWAGVNNYLYIWGNRYFRMGFRNVVTLGGGMIALCMLLSVLLAWLLCEHEKIAKAGICILVLPILIPSVSAIPIWRDVFETGAFSGDALSRAAIISLFLWKYSGVASLILYAALKKIPREVIDAAELDGANAAVKYLRVRLPMVAPSMGLTVIFLLMYFFRIYKECYLLFGAYPPDAVYLLQHYMNNQYMKMNFQIVSAAAVSLTVLSLLTYGAVFCLMRRRRREV